MVTVLFALCHRLVRENCVRRSCEEPHGTSAYCVGALHVESPISIWLWCFQMCVTFLCCYCPREHFYRTECVVVSNTGQVSSPSTRPSASTLSCCRLQLSVFNLNTFFFGFCPHKRLTARTRPIVSPCSISLRQLSSLIFLFRSCHIIFDRRIATWGTLARTSRTHTYTAGPFLVLIKRNRTRSVSYSHSTAHGPFVAFKWRLLWASVFILS